MICFNSYQKDQGDKILPVLFDILYANMNVIAPTGDSYQEDRRLWLGAMAQTLQESARQIILIYDDENIVGYFQYSLSETTFFMEEIQFRKAYQGAGVFQQLYGYLKDKIPPELSYVEAYAHKRNQKLQEILKHLGLEIIGENRSGNSFHFRGNCKTALERYSFPPDKVS